MTLTLPTDTRILDLLKDGVRHTPSSVAIELDDVSPKYASQQLSSLLDDGFVADPYTPNNSGMMRATRRGRIAGHHVHCYRREQHDQWVVLVDQVLDNQWDGSTLHPDIIDISQQHQNLLDHISMQGPAMPTDGAVPVPIDIAMQLAYSLEFHRLIETADGGGYVTTERGERVLDADASIDDPVALTREVLDE